MSYAKVLGATNRQDGYLEGNGYLVSWCVGHLVELAPPNIYDAKYVKWSIADLPILPERWQYLVSASTKKQFGILQKLMDRPDVDSIVCATDAGREGELIFSLVYQRNGESLAAIPQVSHITTFRLQKSGRNFFLFSVFRKKFAIFMLHLFEIFL